MINPYRFVPQSLGLRAHRVREQLLLAKLRRRLARLSPYRRTPVHLPDLLEAVRRKHLVFTVTAGRTGTVYLQQLLGLFPDTTSLHEPEPAFVSMLRLAQHTPGLARQFLIEYKLPAVAAASTTRYVETSHLLCKGFLEPLLDLGITPRFVLLRRSPRQIALSYLARRAVPGRTKQGLKYLVHPGDPGVLPFPGWVRHSDYALCFWYALEIERRQRAYAGALAARGLISVEVTAEELHDFECFLAVAEALGLLSAEVDRARLRRGHREVSAVVHNRNQRVAPAAGIDAAEGAVWEAIGAPASGLRDDIASRYGVAT
jgi:hypothetical protein